MSDAAPDYDNICESIGLRIQRADRTVKAAVEGYATCKTYKAVIRRAEQERSRCVREEKFFEALIHDEILDDATREMENQ